MNKTIKLAVAGAVLSAASVANAGIIIPAGEWTMDINGNVNAYATMSNYDDATVAAAGGLSGSEDSRYQDKTASINTGLLPSWLGFTGTTRQNDLDVSFTISFQPNVSDNHAHGDVLAPRNRQAFLTFGDKSWGTVKMGKDLGIFAGTAILNDMTLLGVGAGAANSGAATTLGGIGTGYIYPAWKGQVAYTTPNMNGLQATIAITNPTQVAGSNVTMYNDRLGLEGQVTYDFNAGSTAGKLWVSGASYEVTGTTAAADFDVSVADIGLTVTNGNLGLTGYYYSGEGAGTTVLGDMGSNGAGAERDSDGGYVQATYVIPTGTKLGVAYGVSRLDTVGGESDTLLDENNRWTVGAYHPLTKHLNLVAEYNQVETQAHDGSKSESDHVSLGAILFF